MKTNPLEGEILHQDASLFSGWDDGVSDTVALRTSHRASVVRRILLIVVCVVICFVTAGAAIVTGEYDIGFFESYRILLDHILGNIGADRVSMIKDFIVWDLRLPAILVAILAGIGLATSGAAMQSTLRNPLADPYTTGISSGAAFGATIAIVYFGGVATGNATTVAFAFFFALIPTALIVSLSITKKVSPVSMIMAGIAVMYIFNAITTMIKLWADPNDLEAIYIWSVGSFSMIRWGDLPMMAAVSLAGSSAIFLISNKLNILASGDECAKSMGIDASRMRIVCLIIVSLVTASIVSFTGIIGFVGLVAPHVVRLFIGSDNKFLIPASAAFGAALLLVSDLVGRTIIAPSVIQVGVITSFIGGPLFLYLVIRQKKEVW